MGFVWRWAAQDPVSGSHKHSPFSLASPRAPKWFQAGGRRKGRLKRGVPTAALHLDVQCLPLQLDRPARLLGLSEFTSPDDGVVIWRVVVYLSLHQIGILLGADPSDFGATAAVPEHY